MRERLKDVERSSAKAVLPTADLTRRTRSNAESACGLRLQIPRPLVTTLFYHPLRPLRLCVTPKALLRAHQAQQFGANLIDAALVGFAFLMQHSGDLRGRLETSLGLLLNLDINHFLQQTQKFNRMHDQNRAFGGPVLNR